jgi:hypothetical protein
MDAAENTKSTDASGMKTPLSFLIEGLSLCMTTDTLARLLMAFALLAGLLVGEVVESEALLLQPSKQ